ncbi:GDSL esterase/lipase At3g26430-like [Castanea sativa]|uniref:GDSL esterase/lipase At3g26430-like n=1 Tax=Castanea sativa TaxID=21020 RepID=UPI003F651066
MDIESHTLYAIFGLIISLALLPNPTISTKCSFPAIFNFGASNADTGGYSALFGQVPPPNGETYFHTPSGRICDGRLVIDFIAENFGLPYLSAFLDSVGSNFSHGANFATVASSIGPQDMPIALGGNSPISLDVQFAQFSDFHRRSQILRKQGGVFEKLLPQEDYFSQALYTFDIGQNDLTAGYKKNLTTEQIKAYVPDVMGQFSNIIKKIYGEDGRIFWVHNTGPLGCLPYFLDRFLITAGQMDKYGCASPFNEAAQYLNLKLKEALAQLRKDLPEARITYVDIYSVKYTLITQAKKYGFEKPFIVCCGQGGKYNYHLKNYCGLNKTIGGKEIVISNTCKDLSVRVNWDGTHFTEAANKWVFNQIASGSFTDPPISLDMACQRN